MISTHTGAVIAGIISVMLAVNGVKQTVHKVVMDEPPHAEMLKGVR